MDTQATGIDASKPHEPVVPLPASTKGSVDRIMLFPSYGRLVPDGSGDWEVNVSGWLFRTRENSKRRRFLMGLSQGLLSPSSVSNASATSLYQERSQGFFAESLRKVSVRIAVVGMAPPPEPPLPQDQLLQQSTASIDRLSMDDKSGAAPKEGIYKLPSTDGSLQALPDYQIDSSADVSTDHADDEANVVELDNTPTTTDEVSALDAVALETHTDKYVWTDVLTDKSGRFVGSLRVPQAHVDRFIKDHVVGPDTSSPADPAQKSPLAVPWLRVRVLAFAPGHLTDVHAFITTGLIGQPGVSLISDIDDTIKDSSIFAGARTAFKIAFMHDAKEIPGMSDCYNLLAVKGVPVHYVSAAPFQLYPPVAKFLRQFAFPEGSVNMRNVLESSAKVKSYKNVLVMGLLNAFPERKFILVGDSGEKDIDIYAAVDQALGGQVLKIFIRNVTRDASKHPELMKRVEQAYAAQAAQATGSTAAVDAASAAKPAKVDLSKWAFFVDPDVILTDATVMEAVTMH
ncbi:hypothetical protein BC831DRAFT_415441 [Entophlyctis helioformis]|nr:hypothetical protein BC831DRAFT_415441 [Entophlyctis helioformis]